MRFALLVCGAFASNLMLTTWHAYNLTHDDPPHWSNAVLLLVSLSATYIAWPAVRRLLRGDIMITDEERSRLIAAARHEAKTLRASGAPRMTFWLSFVDPERPEGQQFLGAAIIPDCVNGADAIEQAYRHGCNPGGAVAFAELPPIAFEEQPALKDAPTNVLMPKAELVARNLIVDEPS